MSARDTLRGMAFQLATSSGVVPPDEFDAALDAYRAEVLREAADAIAENLAETPEYGEYAADFLRSMAAGGAA